MEVIKDQITDQPINIVKKATCSSLSGQSKLSYSIGKTPDNMLLVRIDENSGAGRFNCEWIPVDAILKQIEETEVPFHSSVLKILYEKKSSNSAGFLCACLMHLGLVSAVENGGYERTKKSIESLSKKPRNGRARS